MRHRAVISSTGILQEIRITASRGTTSLCAKPSVIAINMRSGLQPNTEKQYAMVCNMQAVIFFAIDPGSDPILSETGEGGELSSTGVPVVG